MPRAMWSGSISFGLVNVPVKMFTAARSKDVHFNQLHAPDRSRIQMKRFCAAEQTEIEFGEIVKGYEVGPDEYVVVTEEEMAALAPTVTSGIEIEEFVDLAEIDPVFFEHSYYLVPDKAGQKAYALLMGAMKEAGRIALGRVVLRQKQYLVALRPAGRALAMSTLYFPDEVVSQDELDGLPGEDLRATDRELAMAQQLISALSTEFEPEKYKDEYRDALLAMIDEKAQGVIVELAPRAAPAAKVTDLMAALEASIAAAKQAKAS
ncbi:MAG: Ku protein [Dehalococcoidia bacterium]